MNSTPAASKARRTAKSFAMVIDVSPSASSARLIVASPKAASRASSAALHRRRARAARIWALFKGFRGPTPRSDISRQHQRCSCLHSPRPGRAAALELAPSTPTRSRCLTVAAAPAHAITIRRAAEMLGKDEELLWDMATEMGPKHGRLWIYDTDDQQTVAFIPARLEYLQEMLPQYKRNRSSPRS